MQPLWYDYSIEKRKVNVEEGWKAIGKQLRIKNEELWSMLVASSSHIIIGRQSDTIILNS